MSKREAAGTPVAIVGGGISGIAAAHALHEAGVPFRLLEASAELGGVIRTDAVDGFLLEGGPDSILAQKPEGIALCRKLGLGSELTPTNREQRAVYVLHRGRLVALPDGMALAIPTRVRPFLRSPLFSWAGKLRMGLDLVIPARRDGADESIASFLGRRFGRECVERIGEPLLAGIHSGDPERLSMLSTFPRFVEMERRYGSLVRAMWSAPRQRRAPGEAPPAAFYTLRGGLAALVRALVAALPADVLWAGQRVTAVTKGDDGFHLAIEGRGERSTLDAAAVILALPVAASAALLRDLAPDVAAELSAIRSASTATVLLGYRRQDVGHPLDGYGMVVPAYEGLRTGALSFFSTKFPGRAPAGHVLLRGFVGGMRDPDALTESDQGLVDLVRREMREVLRLRGEPVLSRVYRWPQGTPQMEVGHGERVARIERTLDSLPGLYLTGAGLRGTGIPDCVADASRIAATARSFASSQTPLVAAR